MKLSFKGLGWGVSVAALSSLLLVSQTNAVPLPAGSTVFAVGEPDPIGGVVIGSLVTPFVGTALPNSFAGTITSTVISGDASNPFGGLTFTYLFTITAASPGTEIGRLTVEGFAGFLVDASYQLPVAAGSESPTVVDRSSGAGDIIGFVFLNPPLGTGRVGLGESSALLVVQTSATSFATKQGNIINGATANPNILAPGVPDGGATVMLLGCVLVGIEGLRRRFSASR